MRRDDVRPPGPRPASKHVTDMPASARRRAVSAPATPAPSATPTPEPTPSPTLEPTPYPKANGTLIDEGNIARIAAARFDYVGISIDGLEAVHDDWRQLKGSFAASMHAIDLCRQHDIRVGLRTTLTQNNYPQLPALLGLSGEGLQFVADRRDDLVVDGVGQGLADLLRRAPPQQMHPDGADGDAEGDDPAWRQYADASMHTLYEYGVHKYA